MPAPAGRLFEPGSTSGRRAWLERDAEGRFLARFEGEAAPRPLGTLRGLTQRVTGSARRAEFADGAAFVTEDDEALDHLIGDLAATGRRRLAKFERPRWRNIALLLGCVLLLGLGLRIGLPVVVDRAAMAVPSALEARLGALVFAEMDGRVFAPTTLPPERQAALQALFARLVTASDLAGASPALLLRASGKLGANALAFPGGPVVITDALVALAQSDAALAGVMAHELAHVRERHGLRQAMRAGSVLLLVALVFGDSGTLIDELAAGFGLLIANSYSRAFEREADAIAATMLRELGIPIEDLAQLIERLDAGSGSAASWFSTHPGGAERAQALRAAP